MYLCTFPTLCLTGSVAWTNVPKAFHDKVKTKWTNFINDVMHSPRHSISPKPSSLLQNVRLFVIAATLSIRNVEGCNLFIQIYFFIVNPNSSLFLFFFYSCSFQGCLSRDETLQHLILCCWDSNKRVSGSDDPQKVKNLIFCSLVNATSDS